MKKSLQSIMTAAMFAAATSTAVNASAAEASLMNQTYSPDQLLYGPPPRDCVLGDMNLDGEIDVRDLSALKKVILSTEEHKYQLNDYGDPDGDGWLTIWGGSGFGTNAIGDLNQDMVVDKADVQEMIRRLTGAPKDEDDPIVTTMTVETEVETMTQTSYGPPPAWN